MRGVSQAKAYRVITTDDELRQVLASFGPVQPERPKIVAVDTEFKPGVKKANIPTILSLVQMQIQDTCFLIDVLSHRMKWSREMLGEWLTRPDIIIVLHSAYGDLDALYAHTGRVPYRLFDTQVAHHILGGISQIGLKSILDETLGIDFPKNKKLQKCNWTRRPLTSEQLDYAALDVLYLPRLVDEQHKRLQALNRADWAAQESTQVVRDFLEKATGERVPLPNPVKNPVPHGSETRTREALPLLALAHEATEAAQKEMLDEAVERVATSSGLLASVVPRKLRDQLMSGVERCVLHECAATAAAEQDATHPEAPAAPVPSGEALVAQVAAMYCAAWTPWRQEVFAAALTATMQQLRLLVLQKYQEYLVNPPPPPPPQDAPAAAEQEATPEAVPPV